MPDRASINLNACAFGEQKPRLSRLACDVVCDAACFHEAHPLIKSYCRGVVRKHAERQGSNLLPPRPVERRMQQCRPNAPPSMRFSYEHTEIVFAIGRGIDTQRADEFRAIESATNCTSSVAPTMLRHARAYRSRSNPGSVLIHWSFGGDIVEQRQQSFKVGLDCRSYGNAGIRRGPAARADSPLAAATWTTRGLCRAIGSRRSASHRTRDSKKHPIRRDSRHDTVPRYEIQPTRTGGAPRIPFEYFEKI